MPVSISASVGENGRNHPEDVRTVFALFNKFLVPPLAAGDQCSPGLIQAIKRFQAGFLTHPDGRIDVGGTTWRQLLTAAGEHEGGKRLLLSFDDGPAPESALDAILDTLAAQGIKAEFYVLGSEVDRYPAAARRIVSRGHSIQNHSYSHPNLAQASEEAVRRELQRTQESIRTATGVTPTKVRPPYGAGGWPPDDPQVAEVAKELSLEIVNWDIDTVDWKTPKGIGPAKLANIREQLSRNGRHKAVLTVLMHVQKETAKDLSNFIEQLKRWGHAFAAP